MITRRRMLLAGVVVAAFLVGLVGWRIWQVQRALSAGESAAGALEEALRTGDDAAADRAQRDLASRSAAAADGTSGPVWSVLARLPMVGDDADALRLLSSNLRMLTREAVPALREIAAQRDDLLPRDGRVPIERLAALSAPLGRADATVTASAESLGTVDPDSLLGPLQDGWRTLTARIGEARSDLAAARAAVDLLPRMLGQDGTRRYLLIFENNAEIRATGGLPGSAAELVATDGRLTLGRQVAGSDLVGTTPVLPLTASERRIYGPRLGSDFRQANWTPDFPRSAALWEAHWNGRFPAEPVDGALALDPVALSYLLRATGPITVDGVELTAENAADELVSTVYARIPNPPDQDVFFQQVAAAVFSRLTDGVDDTGALLNGLRQGVEEGRIRLESSEASEQERIARFSIAGVLPREATEHPQLGVYLIDATGSKMSYYLRSAVRVRGASCVDGVQRLDVAVTLSSTLAPDAVNALPDYVAGDYEQIALNRGEQLVAIRLYAPVGGAITEVAQDDGSPQKARPVDDQGRPVSSAFVVVPPGGSTTVTWRVLTGAGQTADPQLQVTPGIVEPDTDVAPTAC